MKEIELLDLNGETKRYRANRVHFVNHETYGSGDVARLNEEGTTLVLNVNGFVAARISDA